MLQVRENEISLSLRKWSGGGAVHLRTSEGTLLKNLWLTANLSPKVKVYIKLFTCIIITNHAASQLFFRVLLN